MNMSSEKYIRLRTALIGIFFSGLYIIIGARAAYLQILQRQWLQQKASNQYEKSFVTQGKRGTIYDRNHRELAVSIDVTSIGAYPGHIINERESVKTLSAVLNIDRKTLERKLTSTHPFVWVKRHAFPKEAKAVDALKIGGIDYIPEHSRAYPNRTLAAQVLGFTGVDGHGLEGIEFYYDSYLRGPVLKQTVLKDALGRDFDSEKRSADTCYGKDLILTIDGTIQFISENAIEETVKKYSAKSGMAIVMEPSTGAILAIAHYPEFNPNAFENFSRDTWRNRSITDPFEPGSTMKIFLAAAAIESGTCTPNSIFYCENGSFKIGSNTINDAHPHAWLSLQQIVKYSSNIGAIKITEKMGKETLYKTLCDFGFGRKTGIDCPGETSGVLTPYTTWSKVDEAAISFGQGVSASALQLITATSAIANGGLLMKPYIVQAVTDENGRILKQFLPHITNTVISAKTSRLVKTIMNTVTTDGGTGENAALKDYSVCGKTGTAQKINRNGQYSEDKYIASFVGFAPENNPEVAVLVVIDEPESIYYGGTVAAPAFKKIVLETLNYMNAPANDVARKQTPGPKTLPGDTDRLTVSIENEVNV